MNIADRFTLSRIVLSPVFFLVYFLPAWSNVSPSLTVWVMIPLLAFMEFTDFLDGFFARKLKQVSDFGKLFDPFADVLVHLTTFCCLVISGYMPGIVFMLILYREFCMNFIRMMAIQKGVAIGARKGGKFKTVLYVITTFYCILMESCVRLEIDVSGILGGLDIGRVILIVLCLIAAYASFTDYLVHFGSLIKADKKN
ncbi:MAG: CDP-diacylglycerol--glycerol-3-phosphate 3-phosphatidyltransferase [Spirochaetaceae bacterium]|nr:CDP-diacylglycerol--glycerol-3-phosphate 3-phosphatidyltransferase [Spirochaetaceae bacterium]MBR6566346.1 CDP-diacylglycerol--glycerol-3-phosphate 3-phosphatidyltransferase [Spirochaetaceae bacterium]